MGAKFPAPVQNGPGAHPTCCTMGTGSFLGVKSGRRLTLTPHPFYCRGQERVELYLYSPYGPYGLYRASVRVQGSTLHFFSYSSDGIATFYLPDRLFPFLYLKAKKDKKKVGMNRNEILEEQPDMPFLTTEGMKKFWNS